VQLPTAVGTAVVDQHGATLLAMRVLVALLECGRTGQGVHVEVSMLLPRSISSSRSSPTS
jgi:crotonobetainyl-CoA:carnitine CoA-transferase CaiB-like acyl-CoA transferase